MSAKKLLVADDNNAFLTALKDILEKGGYNVTVASDGSSAQHLLSNEHFDAVIADIKMPYLTGIELLRHIKQTQPIPVILMTGFSDMAEAKTATELGADGFIAKPFKKEELFSILKEAFEKALQPQEIIEMDEEFCKLSIDEFVSGKEIKQDIFVRINSSKYVKIAHQGENLSMERITAFKGKGIYFLHLKREDFRKYIGFNLSLAPHVKESKALTKEKKLAFMKQTSELIVQNAYLNGVDEEAFESARTMMDTTMDVITDDHDIMTMLKSLNSHTDHLYAHSLGVSIYATMIARSMRWNSSQVLFKVTMGGLFHDIGKKELPVELLNKPRKEFTADDIKLFESHPARGMEILSQIESVPSDVVQIAMQHHENCLGIGYPLAMSKNKIHPMAKLVSVANEFCNLTLKGPGIRPLPATEAIQRLQTLFAERLDPAFLAGLMRVFKMVPPAK